MHECHTHALPSRAGNRSIDDPFALTMDNRFFEHPILNSPYEYPARHWELDDGGQPTHRGHTRRLRKSNRYLDPQLAWRNDEQDGKER